MKSNSREKVRLGLRGVEAGTFRWLADFAFALVAAALSVTLTVFFASRWTALVDFSYLPNLSFSVASGNTLWTELDHPLTPGSTLVSLWFYSVFGWSSLSSLGLIALIAGSSSFLTFKILLSLPQMRNREIPSTAKAFLALQAGIMGPALLVPFPFPDNFATLACLLAVFLAQKAFQVPSRFSFFCAGVFATFPFFFKQNVGLFFFIFALLGLLVLASSSSRKPSPVVRKQFIHFLLGATFFPSLLVVFLISAGLFSEMISQIFFEAGSSKEVLTLRQLEPYLGPVGLASFFLGVLYVFLRPRNAKIAVWVVVLVAPALLFLLPQPVVTSIEQVLATLWFPVSVDTRLIFLVAGPFAIGIVLAKAIRKDLAEEDFLLLAVAGILFGAFLSQGFQGSSYALMPLLTVFIWASATWSTKHLRIGLAPLGLSMLLIVYFLLEAWTGARLQYVNLEIGQLDFSDSRNGPTAFIPVSKGQHESYITLSEVLSDETGTVLFLPSEDPVPFLAPDSTTWGRCVQFMENTCPSYRAAPTMLASTPPDVFVHKTNPQFSSQSAEPFANLMTSALITCGKNIVEVDGYVIVRNFVDRACLEKALNLR